MNTEKCKIGKKKEKRVETSNRLFETFGPAAEGAEEEEGDGTGEENTGSNLDERGVVGGGEKRRRGEGWDFDGSICTVSCDCCNDICEKC